MKLKEEQSDRLFLYDLMLIILFIFQSSSTIAIEIFVEKFMPT